MDLLDPAVPVTELAETLTLDDLRQGLIDACAAVSAGQARIAQAMAIFRSRGGAQIGSGFTSFGQWASVDLGMTSRAATGLADAGDALSSRPSVRDAWESGALSATKAQSILSVATDASETDWCDLAREASATQLARIAAAYRRNERIDAEKRADADRAEGREADDREAACGAWWHTRDDGLAELLAVLTPDDAAVARAALDTETETRWRTDRPAGTHDDAETTRPAPRPTATRRLDALVGIAANRLAAGTVPIVRGEHTEVVLHVDQAFLRGDTQTGRSHLTNGTSISLPDARRLACDARIRGLLENADGTCVDLGRSQRLVSNKQRRLLTARDHGCRFPGCANTRYVDAHHVHEWEAGGPTNMANLILLCNRHHRLVHHGSFRIDADGHENFAFFDRFDHPVGPPDTPARHRCRHVPDEPRARSGGNPDYSIDLAVTAMASATHATLGS